MSALSTQLVHAYRQEQLLYNRILELVHEQQRCITQQGNPRGVLALCGDVERLLDEIGTIEAAIEPTKKRWEQRVDHAEDSELDAVLAQVQAVIEQTALAQEQVRRRLLEYVGMSTRATDGARESVRLRRARFAYHSA